MKTAKQPGGSSGDRPISKITAEQALWLNEVCLQYIPFIVKQCEDLTWQDAEDIVAHQKSIVAARGFDDIYSKEIRLSIQNGFRPSREKTQSLLRYHLNRRVADHFRRRKTIKGGYVPPECDCGEPNCSCIGRKSGSYLVREVSNQVVALVPDESAKRELDGITARSDLDFLYDKAWPSLNEIDRAILTATRRNPAGCFNRSSLYEAMTKSERELFLTTGIPIFAKEEAVKCAIASRTGELRRKLRQCLAEERDDFAFYGA
jgi:hypothetical protein